MYLDIQEVLADGTTQLSIAKSTMVLSALAVSQLEDHLTEFVYHLFLTSALFFRWCPYSSVLLALALALCRIMHHVGES